jgi:hypothetical protein
MPSSGFARRRWRRPLRGLDDVERGRVRTCGRAVRPSTRPERRRGARSGRTIRLGRPRGHDSDWVGERPSMSEGARLSKESERPSRMVRKGGFEPPRPCGRQPLKRPRRSRRPVDLPRISTRLAAWPAPLAFSGVPEFSPDSHLCPKESHCYSHRSPLRLRQYSMVRPTTLRGQRSRSRASSLRRNQPLLTNRQPSSTIGATTTIDEWR